MTPEQFYNDLANRIDGPSLLTLSPGPVKLAVNKQDAMAARMLLWLVEAMPDDATVGDMEDVLDAAKFWSTFWSSLERDDVVAVTP